MLVLSRREGENVMIGENIKVTVLQIEGRNIRLGFEAPDDIAIHREEIFNRIREEKSEVVITSLSGNSTISSTGGAPFPPKEIKEVVES